MALSSKITTLVSASQTGDNDFGGPGFTPSLTGTINTTDGTAAGQADLIFTDERIVGDGADDDLDLAVGLVDALGTSLTFVTVVSITVVNGPISGTANTTDLTIGGGTNPFFGFLGSGTDTVGPLKPGASFQIAASDAAGIGTVTAATADILRITNSAGAAATYQICIIGRSA